MKNATIRIHRVGGPEVLELEDVPVGKPGPGKVLIRGIRGLRFGGTSYLRQITPLYKTAQNARRF